MGQMTLGMRAAEVGQQAAGGAVGAGLGMLLAGINDRRQRKQQRKMNQIANEQTEFNIGKQLEMWEKTGYGATKDQMKRADINPALLYGMGGAGGQSTSVNTGSAGGAPVGGGEDAKKNKYCEGETKEVYRLNNGAKVGLPMYYRNKIYSEKERELLWMEKLDKGERWVCGERCKSTEEWYKLVEWYRRMNERMGYGSDKKDWSAIKYENERRVLLMEERVGDNNNKQESSDDRLIDTSANATVKEAGRRIRIASGGACRSARPPGFGFMGEQIQRDLEMWKIGDRLWTNKNYFK